MQELLPIKVKGHLHIEDDLGNVLVDKDNAIHPQNMARVISRALANESNYFIKTIAFGNGGTDINAALDITFNAPNDGQSPDIRTWDSQLYNETYREIVDDSDISIGTGSGSAAGDPATVEHVSGPGVFSNELGVLSQVTVNATINQNEPTGQVTSGTSTEGTNFDGSFTFDEIGLFTGGVSILSTAGYQEVQVGLPSEVTSATSTGLIAGHLYEFTITVDGGTLQTIQFTPPADGTDNGTTWQSGGSPVTGIDTWPGGGIAYDVLYDDANEIWVATGTQSTNPAIWTSDDDGLSWTQQTTGVGSPDSGTGAYRIGAKAQSTA